MNNGWKFDQVGSKLLLHHRAVHASSVGPGG